MTALPAAQSTRTMVGFPLSRNKLARYGTALFGAIALVLFFQPLVRGTVPGAGEQSLTGLELASGEASARADRALFGVGSASLAAGASGAAASSGGLALPTRQATAA